MLYKFVRWYLVSVKLNLGVCLKFLVFANRELGGCEVYFPEKKI